VTALDRGGLTPVAVALAVLVFVLIVGRDHRIRVANGEHQPYQGDGLGGHVAHGLRWLAAAAIIGLSMNRRGNVGLGPLALARVILGRPRRRHLWRYRRRHSFTVTLKRRG
jgi:hypothetical protein